MTMVRQPLALMKKREINAISALALKRSMMPTFMIGLMAGPTINTDTSNATTQRITKYMNSFYQLQRRITTERRMGSLRLCPKYVLFFSWLIVMTIFRRYISFDGKYHQKLCWTLPFRSSKVWQNCRRTTKLSSLRLVGRWSLLSAPVEMRESLFGRYASLVDTRVVGFGTSISKHRLLVRYK